MNKPEKTVLLLLASIFCAAVSIVFLLAYVYHFFKHLNF